MREMEQVEMLKGDFKLGKCNVLLKEMLSQNHVTLMCCYCCNNEKPIFYIINQLSTLSEQPKNAFGKPQLSEYHNSQSLANSSFTPNVRVSCQHQKSAFS